MKNNLSFLAFVLVVSLFSSCEKETLYQNSAMQPTPPPASSTVYLSVTIEDSEGNLIGSDAKGAYVHGVSRVEAKIWSDGDFFMNTNTSIVKAPLRTINFSIPGAGMEMNGLRNYSLRTGSLIGLNSMVIGTEQIISLRFWGQYGDGDIAWRLLYRHATENTATSVTDEAKVIRVSATQWIIQPASSDGVTSAMAALTDADYVHKKYLVAPYKLILNKTGK